MVEQYKIIIRENDPNESDEPDRSEEIERLQNLTTLDLSNNQLGEEDIFGLGRFVNNLTNLRTLNLSNNDIEYGYEILKNINTTLTHLDIHCNLFRYEVESLAKVGLTKLKYIDVSENDIGSESANSLALVLCKCPELTHLNLSNNNFGPEGSEQFRKALTKLTKLSYFNISGNWIQEEGVSSIARAIEHGLCGALIHLNLSENDIRPEGAKILAGVLAKCTVLSELKLCDNKIFSDGT